MCLAPTTSKTTSYTGSGVTAATTLGKPKVGDKVRMNQDYGKRPTIFKGTEGVITDMAEPVPGLRDLYYVDFSGDRRGMYAERFDVIKDAPKVPFKAGDKVRYVGAKDYFGYNPGDILTLTGFSGPHPVVDDPKRDHAYTWVAFHKGDFELVPAVAPSEPPKFPLKMEVWSPEGNSEGALLLRLVTDYRGKTAIEVVDSLGKRANAGSLLHITKEGSVYLETKINRVYNLELDEERRIILAD